MDRNDHPPHAKNETSTLRAISTSVLLAAAWILFVAGTRAHEMLVGAAAVLASALFLRVIHRHSTLHTQFELSDLAQGWRIPWYILSDSYAITAVALRDGFTRKPAECLYRVCGFSTSKDDPRMAARRVLATVYTTATPSFIVIGIDYTQSRMLLHQIERSGIPKMTRALGAKP